MSNLQFKARAKSYEDVLRFVSGKRSRPLAYATTAHLTRGGMAAVRHHETVIAAFMREPRVLAGRDMPVIAMLRTGGWDSATTSQRLHRMIPDCAPVGLSIGITGGRTVVRYEGYETPFDTLVFGADGQVVACDGSRSLRISHATNGGGE